MSRFLGWLVGLMLVACGGSATPPARAEAQHARPAPSSERERTEALETFARHAFQTLQTRGTADLVFDDSALRLLLNPASALRAIAQRDAMPRYSGIAPAELELVRESRFAGACFQGLRDEPSGTVMGLRQPGWVFERVLLVGAEPTGRIALWVEGEFLWTDAGFGAISIQPVETPRRNHSDLELAVCDVDLGVYRPLDIVSTDTFDH